MIDVDFRLHEIEMLRLTAKRLHDDNLADGWYEAETAVDDATAKLVKDILAERGIEIFASACGCCNGIDFKLWRDGKLMVNCQGVNFGDE